MPAKELSETPKKVVTAVRLLYFMIAIGVIRTSMTVIRHADVRSPYFLIFIKLAVYATILFIIYQISKGKNWARWLILVVVTIAFPLAILPIFDLIALHPFDTLLGFLQLALYIVAMVFLFHKSASSWFLRARSRV